MILFDDNTARDVLDGMRLLEGRLLGTNRALSIGAREIRRIAELSLVASRDQPEADPVDVAEDGPVNLVNVDTAARMLGVSSTTVRRLIASDSLDHVRIGRAVRVRVTDIEDFTNNPPATSTGENE